MAWLSEKVSFIAVAFAVGDYDGIGVVKKSMSCAVPHPDDRINSAMEIKNFVFIL